MRTRPDASTARLHPHLIAATLLFTASLALFWPGYAEYDTLRQYEQAVSGQFDDWHPPVMARLWQALLPLGHGTASLLTLQLAGYWLGLALIADALARLGRPRAAWATLAAGLLPPLLGWQGVVLKDAQLVSAALAATGLIARYRLRDLPVPPVIAVTAGVLFAYALLVRANAVFALAPLIVALLPLQRRAARIGVALGIVAAVLALSGTINHRVLRAQGSDVATTQPRYDLAGIAARTQGAAIAGLPAATGATLRAHHCITPYFWDPLEETPACAAALMPLGRLSTGPLYRQLAREALRHSIAYLAQRAAHLNMTERWLVPLSLPGAEPPTIGEPNSYGISAPGAPATAWQTLAGLTTRTPLGWPFAWVSAAVLLLMASRRAPPCPTRRLALGLLASALALEASFAAISIAADVRYHLWPMIATALAAILLARLPSRRAITAAAVLLLAPAIVARAILPAPPQEYDALLRWTPPVALLPR
ncbi:hypothetical protein [Sphingomonas phyllosphaerae]|uniref:hypothetical protein n=1 Tax=Sphingomonas phyllosphaerae TaxID=257003 RepID=UPI00040C6704|nr:hypothetical protein [Sphingomonas phyllosphaerae]